MPHRLGRIIGIVAAATGLALLPSTASAYEGPISGASAGNRNGACTTAAGKFGWELINEGRNLYRTWGKVKLTNRPANCTSDVTAGVLQRAEAVSGGKWRFYAAVARGETGSFWLDDTGVSNVRFRICDVRSGGIIDGCGRVQ